MMRALLLIVAVAPASAGTMTCALDGSAAATDALNAGVFAWAATNRCGKADGKNGQIRCAVDITSALSAVNDMINTILGAANECHALHTENPECGLAVGDFTAAVAGFGSAVSASVNDCSGISTYSPRTTNLGNCVVDLSDSVGGIFDSAHAFKNVKHDCGDHDTCASNVLDVMSAIAALGGAISASSNDCKAAQDQKGNGIAGCAGDILNAVSQLSRIGAAGTRLSMACKVSESRLYEAEHAQIEAASGPSKVTLMVVLGISTSMFAVLGFFAGQKFHSYRMQVPYQDAEARECEIE